MKTAREIELWALEILERVAHGDFHEDSLVELKRELPDPYKTARRIAGHCNAARGETVLWIIGVDENAGVTGRHPVDLANTLPSIWQHFESEPPESCEVSIGFSDTACTALAFSALRVPYMVKNPSFGREAGHVIESEIPWRDGTRIRTARRDEVLRLLIDYSHSPQVEFLSGNAFAIPQENNSHKVAEGLVPIRIHIKFYVMPRNSDSIVIPHHRIRGYLTDIGQEASTGAFCQVRFINHERDIRSLVNLLRNPQSQQVVVNTQENDSFSDTGTELVIRRATRIEAYIDTVMPKDSWNKYDRFILDMILPAGPDLIPIRIASDQISKAKG